ncbi:MAG: exodeoxyribonuclease V alpha subunit, partial [Myxococcota bacterium]
NFLVEDPRTLRGLELYLSSGAIPNMGPTFARRIVARFGLETLQVLNATPERLREIAGIGPKRLEQIVSHWKKDTIGREVHATLRGYGIGAAITRRIVETYADEALKVITEQPYRLAAEVRGIGFRTADTIARERGIRRDSPERAQAALVHVLREAASSEGHCYLPVPVLIAQTSRLAVPTAQAEEAIDRLVSIGMAFEEEGRVYLPHLLSAEERIVRRLARLLQTPRPAVTVDLPTLESQEKIELGDAQRAAVLRAMSSGISVITGGPGTGKTTIVRVLLAAAGARGETWKLAAPTGRAARRLAETTSQEASTIHRLLEYNGRTRRFDKDFADPLECDGVLIDEASMIDARLMDDLLSAVPPGCRLVLVGDVDQLPSVGAGRVLADLIDSGVLPVARLDEVYRQAAHSGIVLNAHRINRGQTPRSGQSESPPRDDFFVVCRDVVSEARDALIEIVSKRLPRRGFNPLTDVQVLTPMHNGPLGTMALNAALQEVLNPSSPAFKRGDKEFRVGDRVIQVRNDYDHDIFNGDVGRVLAISGQGLEVAFESQRVSLKGEKLGDLQLAYAISVHKSQGSEYPAVILLLHRAHRIMLRRNLLYTAVTRARSFCCVIGTQAAMSLAVKRADEARRYTHLAQRLQAQLQD